MEEYILTIITVSFNAKNQLEKTIESINSQVFDSRFHIEYIIQDGISTDGTLDVAKKFRDILINKGINYSIYSEKDNGIYDAMNKAILKANGKWICLLNAGDVFTNNMSLDKVLSFLETRDEDVVYSDYNRINKYLIRTVKIPELHHLRETMIFCHQAIFIRNNIYSRYLYDCSFKLVADYDLLLKLYLEGASFCHLPETIIDYDTEGISGLQMTSTYREIFEVRDKYSVLGNKWKAYLKLYAGIFKRNILSKLPPKLRWDIYKMIYRKYLR